MNRAAVRARAGFGTLARAPLLAWHLGLGPAVGHYFVVVSTRGRKTGRARHTMTFYARSGDRIYIACLYGPGSHWYRNLLANPLCTIQSAAGVRSMRARPVTETEELATALSGSGVARRALRASYGRAELRDASERLRNFPLVALQPSSQLGPEPLTPRWPWAAPSAAVAGVVGTIGVVVYRRRGNGPGGREN